MNTSLRKLLVLALVVTVSSLSACVPRYLTDEPAILGKVVSRSTRRPVAGATVAMISNRTVATRTDRNGDFSLPAIKHWEIYPVFSEGWVGCIGTLRIDAAGYKTYAEPRFSFGSVGDGLDHIDHVRLTLTPDT